MPDDLETMVSGLGRLLSAKSGHLSDAMMAKLMPVFQEIASMDYQLNETTFEQLADSETWAHRIVATVRRFSAAFERVFVPDNHSEVKHSLLQKRGETLLLCADSESRAAVVRFKM